MTSSLTHESQSEETTAHMDGAARVEVGTRAAAHCMAPEIIMPGEGGGNIQPTPNKKRLKRVKQFPIPIQHPNL